jgi:hypothetical protein
MQRAAISLRIDSYSFYAKFFTGPDDSQGDLASIGN